MVFIITFSIATILFHCVDLPHPIKSFPSWSSQLFLLRYIFSYFDTAFLLFFFNSWMIFHCVYLSSSMNMCSFCGDHLGCVCRLGRSKAGRRNTCWDQERLHLSLTGKRQWGRLETRIRADQSQSSFISPAGHSPLLLFIHRSCTPKLLSPDVLKCLSASYCYF